MRQKTFDFYLQLKTAELPDFVSSLVFFGSEVYGIPRTGSDIDIAVESEFPLNKEQKEKVMELIEAYNPPYEYQLVWVQKGEFRQGFDVRRDIFEKGWVV